MTELEYFYNRRLETILNIHKNMILNDNKLSKEFKENQIDKINDILNVKNDDNVKIYVKRK